MLQTSFQKSFVCFITPLRQCRKVSTARAPLGIDIGTRSTRACVLDDASRPAPLTFKHGIPALPSAVSRIGSNMLAVVGDDRPLCPTNTFLDTKLLIGRRFGHASVEQYIRDHPGVNVSCDSDELPLLGPHAERITAVRVQGIILQEVLKVANRQTGKHLTEAVVAVPSHWDNGQRNAIQLAGHLAKLQMTLLNVPVAACLSFAKNSLRAPKGSKILAYCFGRSGFEVSAIHLCDQTTQVLSTLSDPALYFSHSKGVQRTYQGSHSVSIKNESWIDDLRKIIVTAVREAGLADTAISNVLSVGGGGNLSVLSALTQNLYPRASHMYLDEGAVALGCALHSAMLSAAVKDMVLLDVVPVSFGIETADGKFEKIISRNQPLPATNRVLFTTSDDYITTHPILVYQGESGLARNNQYLGHLMLHGLQRARKGSPNIEITFEVATDLSVNVSAIDLWSKATSSSVFQPYRLTHPPFRLPA